MRSRDGRGCRPVRPGATVAVVAPSSPLQPDLLDQGIGELEGLGFKVRGPRRPGRKWRYLAGSDDERLEELKEALLDPEVACIFCARGGYGAGRLLPRLLPSWFVDDPKITVGFSDATVLLNYIVTVCGIPCIHGPMPAQDMRKGRAAYDAEGLLRLLGSADPAGSVSPPGVQALRGGRARGVLMGGCLSSLCSLIGTPFEPDVGGGILLLEDIGEKPYRVDRMLTQMKLAGWFEKVHGVIFGEMPDCVQHPEQGYVLKDVIMDLLGGSTFPILYNFPAGHNRSVHVPLPFGVEVDVDSDHGRLTVLEALVSGDQQCQAGHEP